MWLHWLQLPFSIHSQQRVFSSLAGRTKSVRFWVGEDKEKQGKEKKGRNVGHTSLSLSACVRAWLVVVEDRKMAVGARGGRNASFADLFASPTPEREEEGGGDEDAASSGVRSFASAAESERMMMKRLSFVESSPPSTSPSPAAVRPQSSSAAPHAAAGHSRREPVGILDEKEELMLGSEEEDDEDIRDEEEYDNGDDRMPMETIDDARVDADADCAGDSSGIMMPAFHDSQGQFIARARLAATILDEEGIVQAADRSEHEARMALGADTLIARVEPSPAPVAPPVAVPSFPTPGLMAPRYIPSTTARADASRGPGGYQDSFLTPLVPHTDGGRNGVTMAVKRAREEDGAAALSRGGAMYGERYLAEFPVRDASARRARLDRREEELLVDGQEGGMSKVIASALGLGTDTEGSNLASGSMSRLSEAWQLSKSGRTSLRTVATASTTAVTYAWQRWYEVTLAKRNPKDHHYYSSAMVRARLRLVGRYGYERYRAERLRLSCWRMATLLSRAQRSAATTLARKRLRTQARLFLRAWHGVVGGRREEEVASGRRASRVLRASVRAWRASVVGLHRRETLAECHRAGLVRRQCLRCIASWRRQVVAVRGARRLATLAAEWRQTEKLGRAMREWKRVALSRAAGLKRLFIARRLEQLVLARLSMRAWLSLVHASEPRQSITDADAQFRDEYYISSRAQRLIDDLKAELARAQGRLQSLRRAEDDALDVVFRSSPTPTHGAGSSTTKTARLEAEVVRLQRELAAQQDSSARIAREAEALSMDAEGERARISRLQEELETERMRRTSQADELTKTLAVVDELNEERDELLLQVSGNQEATLRAYQAAADADTTRRASAANASLARAEAEARARAEAEVEQLRVQVATLTGELARSQSESKDFVKDQMITETSLIEAEEDLKHMVEAKAALEKALEVSNARVLEETRRAESLEEALHQAELDHAAFEDELLRVQMEEEERAKSAAAAAVHVKEENTEEDEITIDEYNAALDEAELREIELTEDKDALGNKCTELTHELGVAQARIAELESSSASLDASREAAETKCAQTEGELSIALIQLETMQKQNDELQAEIASSRSALDVQRRDTLGLHEELGEAHDQIIALREDKIAMEEVELEALRTERDTLRAERDALRAESDSLQVRLAQEKEAREALRVEKERVHATAAEDAASAASRESVLTKDLKNARDESESVRGAIQAMELAVRGTKRVDEREDVYTKLDFVRERCLKLARELDNVRMSEAEVTKSLHMERRISESSQDDMVALRAKQEKLQELLDITEGKVRGLEQELTTHREAEASQLKKLESNVAAIRQHRDALLAEVRELKQELLQQQQKQKQHEEHQQKQLKQQQQQQQEKQQQRALVSPPSSASIEVPPKATTAPLSKPAASAATPAVTSPHRRGSFRKASLERWRTGFFESANKSPSGSVDSSSSSGAGARPRSTSSSSATKAGTGTTTTTMVEGSILDQRLDAEDLIAMQEESGETKSVTEASADAGGILDQRLDAEDLIAMQKESKAATTPPPTTTTTTTPGSGKTKRKVGAFKLATRS